MTDYIRTEVHLLTVITTLIAEFNSTTTTMLTKRTLYDAIELLVVELNKQGFNELELYLSSSEVLYFIDKKAV